MTAPVDAPSEQTRQELAAALHGVIVQLGSCRVDFPADLVEASLARDGEVRVITYLTGLAAIAAREASATSGQDPQELVRHFAGLINSDESPDSVLAWKRAADAVLYKLGAPFRVAEGGPVKPADVAAALLSLQVLGCIAATAQEQNPDLVRKALGRRAAGNS